MPNCYEPEHITDCCNNALAYKTDWKVAFMSHISALRYCGDGHLCDRLSRP